MGKMLQIRDMPEEVHRRLKVRAAHAGMTLQAYVLGELAAIAGRPTAQEVLERLGKLDPVRMGADEIVDAVRSGRRELGTVHQRAADDVPAEDLSAESVPSGEPEPGP